MTQEVSIKILHWQNCVTRHNAFLQSRNGDLNLKYGLTNVTFGGFFFFWEERIILKCIMFIDDVHVKLVCRTVTKRIWRFSKVVHVYVF